MVVSPDARISATRPCATSVVQPVSRPMTFGENAARSSWRNSACDGGSAVIGGASRSFTGPPGFGPITATLTEEKCSESDPTAATSP